MTDDSTLPSSTPPWGLDVDTLLMEAQRLDDSAPSERRPLRLAIAATFTSHYLSRILRVMLHRAGIASVIYEVPYGGLDDLIDKLRSKIKR